MAKVDEGSYVCECCKKDRDSMLCCHIHKVFTHLGIDEIPMCYIIQHWTTNAVPGAPSPTDQQPDVMSPQSQKQHRHANMMMDFQKQAKFASASDVATAIVAKHMRAACTEICHLNKCRKKK